MDENGDLSAFHTLLETEMGEQDTPTFDARTFFDFSRCGHWDMCVSQI